MVGEKAVAAVREKVQPAFTTSAADGASPEGSLDAFDQVGCNKGFGEEPDRSGFQRAVADALFGKARDKDERHVVTLGAHMREKVQPAHSWHLHIRNVTRRIVQVGRLEQSYRP
jgi:hypothetical protein